MNNIFQLLDIWGLLEPNINLNKYSKKDIIAISEEINGLYDDIHFHSLGRAHIGVTDSIRYVEGNSNISSLAIQLLLFNQIWLPDPVFSFLSLEADLGWGIMPDSGSKYFTQLPNAHVQWNSYWNTSLDQRKDRLLRVLPMRLERLRRLRPLYEDGIIAIYPWERLANKYQKQMHSTVKEILKHEIVNTISTKFLQDQYNLGARLGNLGIKLNGDLPKYGLKSGAPMWIGDKTPVIALGVLNTLITETLGASFIAEKPGDRLIHDFIRSGGYIEPPAVGIVNSILMPRLSEAVWEDIVYIRKDSESLKLLRTIVNEAQNIEEIKGLESIKDKISNVQENIKKENSIWKLVGGNTTEVMIGGIGGFLSSLASGTPADQSALGAGVGAGLTFIWQLFKSFGDINYQDKKKRIELLTRINNRL